jgi:membrane-associated phospholipid phosphatase
MRTSEWIQIGFATILALAAWIRPLSARRRSAISLLAAFTMLAVILARLLEHILVPVQASIFRDWLPVALMLVPYWQTGQFFLGPNEKIQARLAGIDRRLLYLMPPITCRFGRYTRLSMEFAYMLCYSLVPLGLAVLYVAKMREWANVYWCIVLVPTYLCYAISPFVPALPPRSIGKERTNQTPSKGRIFNLWLLKHGSIQAISFPSAHVASSLAISLVLLRFVPVAGVIFLIVSFWIAVAAVAGGYHYAIDVLLGAVLTLVVFAAWLGHLIPSTLITAPAITFAIPL